MNFKNICINCMREKKEGQTVCSHCGFDDRTYVMPKFVLPPFTVLNGKYLLGKVLGMGGFGITYLAMDLILEHPVAIKEYYVQNSMYRNVTESSHISVACSDFSQEKIYKINREKFENEAKTLASISDLPGIVRVLDFFTEYNTAYIVMEYLPGATLKEYVKEKERLSIKETSEKLTPIMTSLQYVHERNIIHRDISPDNMKVVDTDIIGSQMKLFDFGGAKQAAHSDDDPKSAVVLKKDGYTPIEQIAGSSQQGPFTDVYAMAATIYYCICGKPPISSNARVADPDSFKSPSQMGVSIDKKVEEVLLKGMAIRSKDRYQSMKEFLDALQEAGWDKDPKKKKKVWPFVMAGCIVLAVGGGVLFRQLGNDVIGSEDVDQNTENDLIYEESESITHEWIPETIGMEIETEEEETAAEETVTQEELIEEETVDVEETIATEELIRVEGDLLSEMLGINADQLPCILIKSPIDQNKVLNVADGSSENGANIELMSQHNLDQQFFYLDDAGEGYYYLRSALSNKVLTVENDNSESEANLIQEDNRGSDAQKWTLLKDADGLFKIKSKYNTYIDCYAGQVEEKTNIWLYEDNNSYSQKWIISPVTRFDDLSVDERVILPDGIYTISIALDYSAVMQVEEGSYENEANICIGHDEKMESQKFRLSRMEDGYYSITAMHSGKSIEVAGNNPDAEVNLIQNDLNDTDGQKWELFYAGDYHCYIQSKLGNYIDLAEGNTTDGNNIWLYSKNGSHSQMWDFFLTEE